MISRLKNMIFLLPVFLGLNFATFGAAVAYAAGTTQQNAVCQGSTLKINEIDGGECGRIAKDANNKSVSENVNDLVAQIVNIFSVIVGIVAVIMIIYGGFRYITSGGEAANITTAKNVILYAIIGLVIVAFAQFIVKFVLAKLTGSDTSP